MKRPFFWHWIKYHWYLVRWLPFGGKLWSYADDQMDIWYDRRDKVDMGRVSNATRRLHGLPEWELK